MNQRIGIALGGGGVRGLAHVLALETIDEMGLSPSCLAGTSIGAIIGTLYSAGKSGKEIHDWIRKYFISRDDQFSDIYQRRNDLFRWLRAVRPSWDNSGLLSAERFIDFVLSDLSVTRIEELDIPLRIVATDFERGEQVILDRGDLRSALQASMSIPGIFRPVKDNGRILVDGGVINNLPYDILPECCDLTIAIDMIPVHEPDQDRIPSLVEVTLGTFDMMLRRITAAKLEQKPPDLYLPVELRGIHMLDFTKIDQVWEQSEPAMAVLREKIACLLGQHD
jgi:NTE family protein